MAEARIRIVGEDKASPVFRRVSAELKGMQGGATALRGSLALLTPALAGALSVAGLVSFAKSANAGLLAIKDLSEATGASYENISGLEQIAVKAGGSLEGVSGILVKFNAALKDTGKTKELSAAFSALGLDAARLKALDPAQALLETAQALDKFADDGNKARLTQELFGKSIKDAAPYLRELAEAGELNGKVTADQILQADQFNKQLAQLGLNATNAARDLSGPLVKAINELVDKFKEGSKAGRSFWETLKLLYADTARQQFEILGLTDGGASKGVAEITAEIGNLQQALANPNIDRGYFDKLTQRVEKLKLDLAKARQLDAVMATIDPNANYGNEGRREAIKPSLPGSLSAKGSDAAAKKAAADRLKLAEFAAQQLVDIEEQAAKDTAEAWDYWQKQQIANHKLTADAAKTQWQQVFEFIDAEQEREIQAGQDYLDAINESTKDAKKAGEEIGLVFASAAGQALTQWQGVRKLFQGVLADLAQIAVKKSVTEPLSGLLGNALGGFNWTSLFAGRASGGPVSAGTPYMVGESGPELFLPRSSGTIVPNGAGGGITVNYGAINIGSGVSRNEVMAAMQATKQQTIAAIVDARTRGYAMGPA